MNPGFSGRLAAIRSQRDRFNKVAAGASAWRRRRRDAGPTASGTLLRCPAKQGPPADATAFRQRLPVMPPPRWCGSPEPPSSPSILFHEPSQAHKGRMVGDRCFHFRGIHLVRTDDVRVGDLSLTISPLLTHACGERARQSMSICQGSKISPEPSGGNRNGGV